MEPAAGKAPKRAMDSATTVKAAQSAMKATPAATMKTTATSAVEPATTVSGDRGCHPAQHRRRYARCRNS
jgi:hypothetical protein